MKAILVLSCLLLSGCAAPEQEQEGARSWVEPPTGVPGNETPLPDPVHDIALDHQDCQGTAVVFEVDPDVVQPELPSGFQHRDIAYLIDSTGPTGRAAIVAASLTCEEPPWDIHAYSIYVEPYDIGVDAADREFYAPLAWMDGEARNFTVEHGWNITSVLIDHVLEQDRRMAQDVGLPTGNALPRPGPAVMRVTVEAPAMAEMSANIAGTTGYVLENQTFRFWHLQPTGLLALDVRFQDHGTGGATTCTLGDDHYLTTLYSGQACEVHAVAGVTLPTADLGVRLRWFDL